MTAVSTPSRSSSFASQPRLNRTADSFTSGCSASQDAAVATCASAPAQRSAVMIAHTRSASCVLGTEDKVLKLREAGISLDPICALRRRAVCLLRRVVPFDVFEQDRELVSCEK